MQDDQQRVGVVGVILGRKQDPVRDGIVLVRRGDLDPDRLPQLGARCIQRAGEQGQDLGNPRGTDTFEAAVRLSTSRRSVSPSSMVRR